MSPIIAIIAVGIGVLGAVLSLDRRRHWLVVIPAVVVMVAIPLALLDSGQPGAPANEPWVRVILQIGFGLTGVLGGSSVVGLVLRFAQGSVPLGAHGGILLDDQEQHDDDRPARKGKNKSDDTKDGRREILRGGATIGYLERFALIGAIGAGQPSAVAIIIAIKGLGRFSELDGSEARERFIIGTLTSLAWAGLCAAAAMLAS